MTSKINTRLTVGMLAGVTVIAAGAPQADAATQVITASGFSLTVGSAFGSPVVPVAGDTLVFAGFAGGGTLTGVTLTFNSLVSPTFGGGEPSVHTASAELGFEAGGASVIQNVYLEPTGFNISSDLMAPGNAFGAPYAASSFSSGDVVITAAFTSNVVGDTPCCKFDWEAGEATLTYTYTPDVPLPAALPLMMAGLAGLAALGRRRA